MYASMSTSSFSAAIWTMLGLFLVLLVPSGPTVLQTLLRGSTACTVSVHFNPSSPSGSSWTSHGPSVRHRSRPPCFCYEPETDPRARGHRRWWRPPAARLRYRPWWPWSPLNRHGPAAAAGLDSPADDEDPTSTTLSRFAICYNGIRHNYSV